MANIVLSSNRLIQPQGNYTVNSKYPSAIAYVANDIPINGSLTIANVAEKNIYVTSTAQPLPGLINSGNHVILVRGRIATAALYPYLFSAGGGVPYISLKHATNAGYASLYDGASIFNLGFTNTETKTWALRYANGSYSAFVDGYKTFDMGMSLVYSGVYALQTYVDHENNYIFELLSYIPGYVSDTELYALTDNPWSLFTPQKRIVYFDVGAGSGDGNATGTIAGVSLTAPTATASGASNATASIAGVTLTAPSATAATSVSADASVAGVSLSTLAATATTSAIATASVSSVSLSAPTGTASTASDGTATASIAQVSLTAPTAIATTSATATTSIASVSLTASTATASSDNSATATGNVAAVSITAITGYAVGDGVQIMPLFGAGQDSSTRIRKKFVSETIKEAIEDKEFEVGYKLVYGKTGLVDIIFAKLSGDETKRQIRKIAKEEAQKLIQFYKEEEDDLEALALLL